MAHDSGGIKVRESGVDRRHEKVLDSAKEALV